jgi:pyruvate kinase
MAIETRVSLLIRRRTKIIATLGPASADSKAINRLLESGVNMFRLNMSHGDHDSHLQHIQTIRNAMQQTGLQAAIMADLCGPKIRTGKFENGSAVLKRGEEVTVTTRQVIGSKELIPSQYKILHQDVQSGQRILINDGLLTLEVLHVLDRDIRCRVVHGGKISDHKGINLPDSNVSAPALTNKDKQDARFALEHHVDFLSLSFVRTAEEIMKLRRLIRRSRSEANIIAKIETPQALHNIDEILNACDAIMVARGDLGVELRAEEVPVAQLQLIDKARKKDRPVIVATQVLESMIENPRPTRAEISDISYAVSSGTDAMMLSAETSVGKYPVNAVRMMDRAIRHTESYRWRNDQFGSFGLEFTDPPIEFGDAISNATSQLSKDLLVRTIVVISRSGTSAVTVSAARPSAPILGITDRPEVSRKMELMWGVVPILVKQRELDDAVKLARHYSIKTGLARKGDYILLVAGFHRNRRASTPGIVVLVV